MLDVIHEILKFEQALKYGYYNDTRRPLFSITWDEAMDLWHAMQMEEDNRYMRMKLNASPFELAFEEVEPPQRLPIPRPGEIWGHVYGIRVYVEGLDGDQD